MRRQGERPELIRWRLCGTSKTWSYRYDAVPGNSTQLRIFSRRVGWLWRNVLVRRSQRVRVRWDRQIPHARPLPIARAPPPACHPKSATELLGEHLPGNAATKEEGNASEARAIRDTRPRTLWSSGWNRQERVDKIP